MTIQKTLAMLLAAALSLPGAEPVTQTLQVGFELATPFAGYSLDDMATPEQGRPIVSGGPSGAMAVAIKPLDTQTKGGLNLFILVGNGAVNSIVSKSAATPLVEVRNERNMPVEGAEVVFELPASGPGGYFTGQNLAWIGKTDTNGQVIAPGFTPNQERGSFGIRVAANYRGSAGQAIITQTNSAKPLSTESAQARKNRLWWKIAIVAAVGGATAGGIVWATRSGAGQSTVVLQPGTISIGGPR